jgi:hypothetical protein
MSTQGAIIESLRVKREATAVNITDSTNRKPRLALQVISERKWIHFIKDSAFKSMDEMPPGKLKDPVIIAYGHGDKYVGEVRDGLPDGQGTIASTDGDMYTGGWKGGTPHGFGTYIWADGSIFAGMWRNGERHGRGEYYQDGKEYVGEWEDGEILNIESPICDKTVDTRKKQIA